MCSHRRYAEEPCVKVCRNTTSVTMLNEKPEERPVSTLLYGFIDLAVNLPLRRGTNSGDHGGRERLRA